MTKIPFIILSEGFNPTHVPPTELFILDATPLQKRISSVVHKIELHAQEECMKNSFIIPW